MVEIGQAAEANGQFVHHIGILLFSSILCQVASRLESSGELVKQWLSTILLGAVNIEQSKILDFHALQTLLGRVLPNLAGQRQALKAFAEAGVQNAILRLNGDVVGVSQEEDFYYDPHTKHYTGGAKILKGWCARIRFAEKVMVTDFLHTTHGEPVFMWHDDSFHDLRERFPRVVAGFREILGFSEQHKLSFVVDRGIYGLGTFQTIMEMGNTFFITWEKGYSGDLNAPFEADGQVEMFRTRNSIKNCPRYDFVYKDGIWSKNENIRQLVVRATNPKGNTIEVAILTNDLSRDAKNLIALMFSRWIQENDFKYLDKHYGINSITSYQKVPYAELVQVVEDKQIKNADYKALEFERSCLKKKIKDALLQGHLAMRKHQILEVERQDIMERLKDSETLAAAGDEEPRQIKDLKKRLSSLKQQQTRAERSEIMRQEKIERLSRQLEEVERRCGETQKETSRLDAVIQEGYQKLEASRKSLMDALKVLARNVFYRYLAPFKECYDNYRDDHVLFRNLTHAHGTLYSEQDRVTAVLIPTANFPPKVERAINEVLALVNSREDFYMPDGSGRRLYLKLVERKVLPRGVNAPRRSSRCSAASADGRSTEQSSDRIAEVAGGGSRACALP